MEIQSAKSINQVSEGSYQVEAKINLSNVYNVNMYLLFWPKTKLVKNLNVHTGSSFKNLEL